jgi:hypothetical protein
VVDVDLPLDLEVVIPLGILTVLRLRLLDLGFQPFSLCCTSPLPVKVSWIIHKRKFGFHGEVANRLRLGLAKTKNLNKEILGLIKTRLD